MQIQSYYSLESYLIQIDSHNYIIVIIWLYLFLKLLYTNEFF